LTSSEARAQRGHDRQAISRYRLCSALPALSALLALAAALAALAIAAGTLLPAAARADGDPASDVLVTQSLFVPQDAGLTDAQRARLSGLLNAAERAHYPIRVAIIPTPLDLGAVTEFWRKPNAYARFLGIELSLVYKGPLLIVMPNGFGINWPGHSTSSAVGTLAKIPVKPTGAGLLATLETAVRALATSAGMTVSSDTGVAATHAHSDTLEVLVAIAIAAVIAITAGSFALRRSRQGETRKLLAPSSRTVVRLLGWAVPVVALVLAIGVIVHVLASSGSKRVRGIGAVTENSPYVFPSRRRAPSFSLTDQNGRPVSLAAYRGRPVILTFVDPLTPELDPRAARILNAVEHALPASQRPAILAVSVNVYGDAHLDLERDIAKWQLVTQWRWAVGSPRQLAAVWKHYYAVVDVITKQIAGATQRRISASKMAYLIDGNGYERALFGWPYGVREIEQTVLRLERSPKEFAP
jgi:cytochrome oxidase Cu insertion factor (SCO1/SenC/PrrC family)